MISRKMAPSQILKLPVPQEDHKNMKMVKFSWMRDFAGRCKYECLPQCSLMQTHVPASTLLSCFIISKNWFVILSLYNFQHNGALIQVTLPCKTTICRSRRRTEWPKISSWPSGEAKATIRNKKTIERKTRWMVINKMRSYEIQFVRKTKGVRENPRLKGL